MVLTLDPAPNAPSYSNPDTFEPDTSNYLAWMKVIRDQLSGQALEIGDKTQSATDTTAGKLLKVGDLGWGATGAPVPGDNIDNIVTPGSYFVTTAVATTSPSLPSFGASSGSPLLCFQYDSNNIAQLLVNRSSGDAAIRVKALGVWQPWRNLFASRGSNVNGEWVRFEDGTQICTGSTLTTSSTGDTTWIYPAAFIYPSNPYRLAVTGSVASTAANGWRLVMGGIANGTSINFAALSTANARVEAQASLMAIGRYK
jgi:hypothetical protein